MVGAGYVSRYHIRAVQSLGFVSIAAVVDPDLDRARKVAEQFGIPTAVADIRQVALLEPDVVHILTPPASHCELTLTALDFGAHVFVEKPMAESEADCRRMIAKAREKGLVLSVNHSARMDPIVLKALDLIRKGAIGDILGADFFCSSDYAPYAGGPNIPPSYSKASYPFQDLGVHGLSLLEAFLGTISKADVRYYTSGRNPNLMFDEWRAIVDCEKGAGQMYLSWNARPMQNEIVVHGTKGLMVVDRYLQTVIIRRAYPAPKPVQRTFGAAWNSMVTLYRVGTTVLGFATKRLLPSPGIHVSVVKFYESLSKGILPPVSAEEGARIVSLTEEVSAKADAEKIRRLTEKPPKQTARILVTGATGFLGGALVQRLREDGQPLRLLMRRRYAAFEDHCGPHLIYGNLGDPAAVDRALDGIETVYHVGAAMGGGRADYECANIWGTRNVIESCLRHGVRRLIYVSSLTVLDHAGHKRGVPIHEASPSEPRPELRGFYTQTKLKAEQMILQAVKEHGLPAVIFRPGQIFGPGAATMAPAGTITLGGRWVVAGSGDRPLPLVYIDDVVDALLLAAQNEHIGGSVFHLVDDELVTQKMYIKAAQRKHEGSNRVLYCPTPLALLLAAGVAVTARVLKRDLPLSVYRVRSLRPLWPCDCSAARARLKWKPRVGVREGLKLTFGEPVVPRPALTDRS